MAWAKSAFKNMSNEECADFLYNYMKNSTIGNNQKKAFYAVLHFIVGSLMIEDSFKIISLQAKKILSENKIEKPITTKDYNKIGLRLEHTIPIKIITDYLLSLKENEVQKSKIQTIINSIRGISLITKDEDTKLKNAGLQSKLPEGCTVDSIISDKNNYYSRYKAAGINF